MSCEIKYIEKVKDPELKAIAYEQHNKIQDWLDQQGYKRKINNKDYTLLPDDFDNMRFLKEFGNVITIKNNIPIIDATLSDAFLDKQIEKKIITKDNLSNLNEYFKDLNYEQKVLLGKLTDILFSIAPNFKIELLDEILTSDAALTDFRDTTIQIGKDANFSDITEEIFHVLVEYLPNDILKEFQGKIIHTAMYQDVLDLYGNDETYTKDKLEKEALVKTLSQMSMDIPLEDLMTTTNTSILQSLKKAISKVLDYLHKIFSKIDHNEYYDLLESIMYKEVKFEPRSKQYLSELGTYKSKRVPNKLYGVFPSLGGEKLSTIGAIVVHPTSLFYIHPKDGLQASSLFFEIYSILKSSKGLSPKDINVLRNIKVLSDITSFEKEKFTDEELNYIKNELNEIRDLYRQVLNEELITDTVTNRRLVLNRNKSAKFTFSQISKSVEGNITSKDVTEILVEYDKDKKTFVDNNGDEVLVDTLDYTNELQVEKVMVDELTVPITPYSEALAFFESIGESNLLSLIQKGASKLNFNVKKLTEMKVVNSFEENSYALNTNLIEALRVTKDANNILSKVSALHGAMGEYLNLFRHLEQVLNNNTLAESKLTMSQFDDLLNTVKTWEVIVDNIETSLTEQRKLGNTYYEYENYLTVFKKSRNNLKEVLTEKVAREIAREIAKSTTDKFTDNLKRKLQENEDNFRVSGVVPEKLMSLYLEKKAEIEKFIEVHSLTEETILKKLLQSDGRSDINDNNSKYNLTPFFDKWLVNVRYANDPILASFGAMMDEINNDSDLDFQSVMVKFLDLSELIKEKGGEVAVGKVLTKEVTRTEFVLEKTKIQKRTLTGEIVDVEIDQFVSKTVPKQKEFLNEYGDETEYLVKYYKKDGAVQTYGQLKADIANLDILRKEGFINHLGKNIETQISDLYQIKNKFENEYFHRQYAESWYEIEKQAFRNVAKNENLSIDDVEKIYIEETKNFNELLSERQSLQSKITNLTLEGNKELSDFAIDNARISELTAMISAYYNDNGKLNERVRVALFNEIRTEKDKYKEKDKLNFPLFLKDFTVLIKGIKDENLKLELNRVLYNNKVLKKETVILDALIELHRNLSIRTLTGEEVLVTKFLDNSLWYKPNELFYEERSKIYNQLDKISVIKNTHEYVTINSTTSRLSTKDKLIQDKLKEGKLPINSSLEFYREKNIDGTFKNKEGLLTVSLSNISSVTVYVKDGKIYKREGNTDDISTIWENIQTIVRPYRNKFGFIFDMSSDDQAKVTTLEQQVNELLADLSFVNSVKNEEKPKYDKDTNNYLKKEAKDLRDKLNDIQENIITENYWEELQKLFDNNSNSSMSSLKITTVDKLSFRKNFNKNIDAFIPFLKSEDTNFLRSGCALQDLQDLQNKKLLFDLVVDNQKINYKLLNQDDFEILKHLKRNHVVRTEYDNNQTPKTTLVPSYQNRKVIPSSLDMLTKTLDNKYKDNSIKFEYRTESNWTNNPEKEFEYKQYNGDYKLKNKLKDTDLYIDGDSNSQIINAFGELSDDYKLIQKEWVEDTHIRNQAIASKDKDNYKISNKSYLGYKVPYMAKQYSEIHGINNLFQTFKRDLFGKRNAFETENTRDESVNNTVDNVLANGVVQENITEEEKEIKKGILAKILDVLKSFLNFTDSVGKSPSLYKQRLFIPVNYTNKLGIEDEVTDNIFLASASYLHSLNRAKHTNKNYFKIRGLKNTLNENNPFETKNLPYERLIVLQKTIDAEIYKNSMPSNNIIERLLRLVKKMIVVRTQNVTNVVGWTKNLEAGLFHNYINSVTVPKNLGFRVKQDFVSTIDALKFAKEVFVKGQSITGETLQQYLNRQLNPQSRDINELFRNSDRYNIKNIFFEGKAFYAGMKVGETIISYQLFLDIINRLELKKDGNTIKFLDSFEKVNNRWQLKEGITDLEDKPFTLNNLVEIKRLIGRQRQQTMGHGYKGVAFENSTLRSLFFFVNYLVPLMQGLFTLNRKDFITNQVVTNFNLEVLRYLGKTLQYFSKGSWYWNYMTTDEKRNTMKGVISYTSLFALVQLMKYMFNFDPDDRDAYKKLKQNNQLQNFLLVTTLKTASELEQQSLANPLSDTLFPAITANYAAVKTPMLLKSIGDIAKVSQSAYYASRYELGILDNERLAIYTKNNKEQGIKKGDLKFTNELSKLFPKTFEKSFDFIGQIRTIQTMTNN